MHRWFKVREASGGKFVHLSLVEGITHAYLEDSRNHGDVFATSMVVRRNLVSVRHFQTHGVGPGGHRIAFENGQLRSGRKNIGGCTPVNRIRGIRLCMFGRFLRVKRQGGSKQEKHRCNSSHGPPPSIVRFKAGKMHCTKKLWHVRYVNSES